MVLLIHFHSVLVVSSKLKHLDVFQVDNLGRDEHWRAKRASSTKNAHEQRQSQDVNNSTQHVEEGNKLKENGNAQSDQLKEKIKSKETKDAANRQGKNKVTLKDQNNQEQRHTEEAIAFQQAHYNSLANMSLDNLLVWTKSNDQETNNNSTFSRLWEAVDYYHSPDKEENIPFNVSHFLRIDDSICRVALAFRENMRHGYTPLFLPQVVFLQLGETMGGFSAVTDTTTGLPDGRALSRRWNDEGCRESAVFSYLSHPNTRAVFTTQYQVYDYKKVHSIPLGLGSHDIGRNILRRIKLLKVHMIRAQLLVVVDSSEGTQNVVDNFLEQGYKVESTYDTNIQNYLDKLTSSKFFLSPGFDDSFQIWEALFSGCIPVIQHHDRRDGWFRTFDGLPVAWIDSFENLTPQWLEKEYQKLTKINTYRWEKLTQQWWLKFIKSFVRDQDRNAASNALSRMEITVAKKLKSTFSKEGGA